MTAKSIYALRLQYQVIRFKVSRQFFNQRSKAKTNHTRHISRALSKLQVIPWDSDWFIALFWCCPDWFFDIYLKTALNHFDKSRILRRR